MNAQWCVCVCVRVRTRIYIDRVFRDSVVQAANMFSVTNAKYFKRNCEMSTQKQASFTVIPKSDHSTVHIILKHPDLPLLFCCLIPMKYIMNNSAYTEHVAKCPSYKLLPNWNPLQKCVNTGTRTRRIKPSFNARQISKLECYFYLKSGLN
jgi:hypothetical protein